MVPSRFAVDKFAPCSLQSVKLAPRRSARSKLAPVQSVIVKFNSPQDRFREVALFEFDRVVSRSVRVLC